MVNFKNRNDLRKKWLMATIIVYFLNPSLIFLLMLGTTIKTFPISAKAAMIGYVAVFALIFFLIIYYSAYKQQKNTWLNYYLSIGVLYTCYDYFRIYRGIADKERIFWIIFTFCIAMDCLWYLLSFKLKKANGQFQLKTLMGEDDYKKGLELLKTAENLEDLNARFHGLFLKCPKKYANYLTPFYKEKKKHLKRASQLSF